MKTTKEALVSEIQKGKRIIVNLKRNYDTVLKHNRTLREKNSYLTEEVERLGRPFWKKLTDRIESIFRCE